MGVDLRTPKINFAHLMEKIQPMAVSQFVVWLDEKISEFKVLGSMDLDERMDAPKWIKDYSMSVMVSGISAHGPPEESQSAPKRQRVSMESPKPSHNFRQELDRQARVRTMEPPPVRKRNIVEMPESRAPREEDTSDLDFVDIKKEMLDEDDDISVIGASIPLASGPRDLGSPASRSSRSFSSSSSPTSIHPASINTKGTIDMPTRSPKRSHSSESSVIPVSLIQNTSFSQSPSSSSRVPLLSLTPEISSLVQSATDDNSVSLSMAHSPSNLQLAIPSASKSEPDDDDDLQMSMESYGDSADNLPEDWQQYAQLQDSSMMEGEDPGPSGSQQYTQCKPGMSEVVEVDSPNGSFMETTTIEDVAVRKRTLDSALVCTTSGSNSTSDTNLAHQRNDGTGNLFMCGRCILLFETDDKLREHMKANHHPPYVCDKCGKSFNKKHNLKVHMGVHDGMEFHCTYTNCNKQFRRKIQLTDHMNSHTAIKPYSCQTCIRTFGSKLTLTRHQKLCLDGYIQCGICEKKFLSPSGRTDHIARIHTDKTYTCRCGKVYSRRGSYSRHIKTCPLK